MACRITKIHKLMKEKELYLSPVCEILELKPEGVIAASAPEYEDGGLLN